MVWCACSQFYIGGVLMAGLIPVALDWTAITTDVAALLATPLVLGAVTFVIGVRVGPKFVRMLRSVTR